MTKKKIFSIVLFTTFLIFALFVGGGFPYLLLIITIMIYGYSYYSVRKISKGLNGIFWTDKAFLKKGEIANISYKIYNSCFIPLVYAEVEVDIPKRLTNQKNEKNVHELKSYSTLNFIKKLTCDHRGIFDVGVVNIETGDIFGLFRKKIVVKDNLQLTVYPKVHKLDSFTITGTEFFGSIPTTQKFYEDYTSIKDLRKYQVGDSLKKVNWKVTAKRGDLFVKNYDISTNVEIQLFLDFQIDKYKYDTYGYVEEKIVECVVSIIHYSLYNRVNTDFITYTEKKVQLHGKDSSMFNKFLEMAVRIRPKKNISLGDVIINESRALSPGTSIIIVTPELDKKLISAILKLKKLGYSVILIIVNDFQKYKNINKGIDILEKTGVNIYKIDIEDNITNVLR